MDPHFDYTMLPSFSTMEATHAAMLILEGLVKFELMNDEQRAQARFWLLERAGLDPKAIKPMADLLRAMEDSGA